MKATSGAKMLLAIIPFLVLAGLLLLRKPAKNENPGRYSPDQSNEIAVQKGSSENRPNPAEPNRPPAAALSPDSPSTDKAAGPTAPDGNRTSSRTEIDLALDAVDLPPPSLLSASERERAVSSFESQRKGWLAVKTGLAKYKTKVRLFKNGEFLDVEVPSQTGTLEFRVTPLSNPSGRESPAKIQVRMSNDKHKWNFSRENALSPDAVTHQWADDPEIPIKGKNAELAKGAFQAQAFFFPFDLMAKSYPDERWSNRYMLTRDKFFAEKGMPRRLSTKKETEGVFAGEQQYLFMASPALVDAHYWLSAENGDLRQIDVISAQQNVIESFRYEDYYQNENESARFPKRFVHTWKMGTGNNTKGWEYVVELADVKLNTEIPAQRFVPPEEQDL